MNWTRRAALLGAGAAIGAVATRYVGAQLPSMDGLTPLAATGPTELNDASLLSPTPIFKHTILQDDPGEALLAALRAELKAAAAEGRPVSVGAARHSCSGSRAASDARRTRLPEGREPARRRRPGRPRSRPESQPRPEQQ